MMARQHQFESNAETPESDETGLLGENLSDLASAARAKTWMKRAPAKGSRFLSANEVTSIGALISYVASKSGSSEFGVERRLADRFHVANVKCLPAAQFDAALRYLADQVS